MVTVEELVDLRVQLVKLHHEAQVSDLANAEYIRVKDIYNDKLEEFLYGK